MSVEWMVALAVFAGVGVLWYSQRTSTPYQRSRGTAPSGGDAGSWSQGDAAHGDGSSD